MKIERVIFLKTARFLVTAAILLAATTSSASAISISASVESKITVEINAPEPEKDKNYTGIIVDCRGLGLQRAMSPVIKNPEGVIIYGDKNIDPDKIVDIGMAGYATSMKDVERAGKNPLIVKAISVANFKCNPVISMSDAEKVLIANSVDNFLDEANVVFLTD